MEEKLSLVITLPESLAGLPIRFEVNSGCRNIALNLESSTPIKKKYLLIWNQTDYLKVDDEDILWIKADGSWKLCKNERPIYSDRSRIPQRFL